MQDYFSLKEKNKTKVTCSIVKSKFKTKIMNFEILFYDWSLLVFKSHCRDFTFMKNCVLLNLKKAIKRIHRNVIQNPRGGKGYFCGNS